jgi:CBS domain-containing protein
MKVEDVMSKDVGSCEPSSSLNDAARVMWERDCGFVPVVEQGGGPGILGVLTDRDVCMAAYTQGRRLAEIRVGDVMSRTVQTCRADDTLAAAEAAMRASQVRRLPVVDAVDQLVGVISLSDIARRTTRARRAERVTSTEVGETLARISQPRQKGRAEAPRARARTRS